MTVDWIVNNHYSYDLIQTHLNSKRVVIWSLQVTSLRALERCKSASQRLQVAGLQCASLIFIGKCAYCNTKLLLPASAVEVIKTESCLCGSVSL